MQQLIEGLEMGQLISLIVCIAGALFAVILYFRLNIRAVYQIRMGQKEKAETAAFVLTECIMLVHTDEWIEGDYDK